MATIYNQATLTYNGVSTTSNIATGELVEMLNAAKTATRPTYNDTESVTYVISLVNTSDTAYTGLTITDNLGAYNFGARVLIPLDYIGGSAKYYVNGTLQGTVTVTEGPPLVFSGISVPAGGNAVIVYEARPNSYAPLGVESNIRNEAVISGNGVAADITVSENVAPATGARLRILKEITPSMITEGSPVTYTFTIQNLGNVPITTTDSAVIRDTFEPILNITAVSFNGTTWTSPTNYTYDTTTGLFTTVDNQITVPAATYVQDPTTGAYSITPGVSTLTVTGTL